jgi:PHD/YefM family antitoxin component YafN of YafNO toxin-antitoxin module
LVSATSRLVLEKGDGSQTEVLVPESEFAQAQLTLGLTL